MAESQHPPVLPVACLIFRSTAQPCFGEPHYIYPNKEVDIGRQLVQDVLNLEDRCVSNHHVRIHCVMYDDAGENQVAPMIYMRVLSSKHIILRRYGLDDEDGGIVIGRDQGHLLLNDCDQMQLTESICVLFRTSEQRPTKVPRLDNVQMAEAKCFASRYQLTTRVLGVGGHAAVYVAVKRSTGQQFACKIVRLEQHGDKDADRKGKNSVTRFRQHLDRTAREYTILQKLSHPNIITVEKVFRTPHNVYILQELITGGDLLSWLDMCGPLPEPQAAMIVRQLLEAVQYLHANHVVHRDIKPDNILMTSWREGARIVLTDFGQSRTFADMRKAATQAGIFRMQTTVGTVGYTAPEIYHRVQRNLEDDSGYSQAIDIWSVGCVTGVLVSNIVLPDSEGLELEAGPTTLSQNNNYIEKLDTSPQWQRLGRRAKDFIRGCLATDEAERLTATQCLAHKWFQHKYYRADFDAAYKRAVQDWTPKPKGHDGEGVELIDTRHIAHEDPPQEEEEEEEEEEEGDPSPYFPDASPAQPGEFFGAAQDVTSNSRAAEAWNATPAIRNTGASAMTTRNNPNYSIPSTLSLQPPPSDSYTASLTEAMGNDVRRNLELASQNLVRNRLHTGRNLARQPLRR